MYFEKKNANWRYKNNLDLHNLLITIESGSLS